MHESQEGAPGPAASPDLSTADPTAAGPAFLDQAPTEAAWQVQWRPAPTGTLPPHAPSSMYRSRYWAGGVYADAPLHEVNAGLSNTGCAVIGLLGAAFVLALAAQIACWVIRLRLP